MSGGIRGAERATRQAWEMCIQEDTEVSLIDVITAARTATNSGQAAPSAQPKNGRIQVLVRGFRRYDPLTYSANLNHMRELVYMDVQLRGPARVITRPPPQPGGFNASK